MSQTLPTITIQPEVTWHDDGTTTVAVRVGGAPDPGRMAAFVALALATGPQPEGPQPPPPTTSQEPIPPRAGETVAEYAARYGVDLGSFEIPGDHRWDPWASGRMGAWVPADARFTCPPGDVLVREDPWREVTVTDQVES